MICFNAADAASTIRAFGGNTGVHAVWFEPRVLERAGTPDAGPAGKKKLFSLLGGGHLTTTIQKYNIPNTFSYISLSGGALLAYLAGKELPGLKK